MALALGVLLTTATGAVAGEDWRRTGDETATLLGDLIRIDTTNPPGGETAADVGARMDELIRDRLTAGRILVFGHGHALRVLIARWLELPAEAGRAFLLAPAAIGVTGSEHDRPGLARWNP